MRWEFAKGTKYVKKGWRNKGNKEKEIGAAHVQWCNEEYTRNIHLSNTCTYMKWRDKTTEDGSLWCLRYKNASVWWIELKKTLVLGAIGGNSLGSQDLLRDLQNRAGRVHIGWDLESRAYLFAETASIMIQNLEQNPQIAGEILKSQVKSWNHWRNHEIAREILKSGRNPEITGEIWKSLEWNLKSRESWNLVRQIRPCRTPRVTP